MIFRRWFAPDMSTSRDTNALRSGIALHVFASAFEFVPIAVVLALLIESQYGLETITTPPVALAAFVALSLATMGRFICLNMANARCYAAGFGIGQSLRTRAIGHLRHLPADTVHRFGASRVGMLVTDQINTIEHVLAHDAGQFVSNVCWLVLCLGIMLWFNTELALISAATFAVTFALFLLIMSRLKVLSSGRAHALADASSTFAEFLRGLPVLRSFGRADGEMAAKCDAIILRIADVYRSAMRRVAPLIIGGLLVSDVAIVVVLAAIAIMVGAQAEASTPRVDLAVCLVTALAALIPIIRIQKLLVRLRAADEGARQLKDFLKLEPLSSASSPTPAAGFAIEMQNVGFKYPGAERAALQDVSITIPERSIIAIVGPSGAGKTTFAQLICRFFDPSSGSIRIGGTDLRSMSANAAPRTVAVLQDMILFNASVCENIALGASDATQRDIESAAVTAGASAFIEALPDRYQTNVGEGGAQISGGERARIAMARALVKPADIVILDEPTAALDAVIERELHAAIRSLARRSTVILVTHRLQMAQWADQVVIIDDGRLRDTGSHDALLLRDALYQRLWRNHQQALVWSFSEGSKAP